MKKVLSIILLGVLLISCGSNKEKKEKENEKKTILIGTNAEYKPYEYLDGDKLVGFDIEFAEIVFKKVGYDIEWKDMSFDGLIPELQSKKIDAIIAGMTPTKERAKNVDFTDIYYSTSQGILVNKSNTTISNLKTLEGKTIGVQLGTLQDTMATAIKDAKVKRYNSFTGAVLDLKSGKIDSVLIGEAVAKPFLKENKGIKLAGILDNSSDGSAIAFPKGNKVIVNKLNKAIKEFKKEKAYTDLVKKYFK